MNYKIAVHYMPWEIDYALLNIFQIKKSLYHINLNTCNIIFEPILNLSNYIIDWKNSKLPKEYFIEKFNSLLLLLDNIVINKKIYDGDELYGCIDSQRESTDNTTDFYITICPDIYFSEQLLFNFIESSKKIKNEYFIVTAQISKKWDYTWDVLVNDLYKNDNYKLYCKASEVFDIEYDLKYKLKIKTLNISPVFKFAGWCDLYNKNFYKNLVPAEQNWVGYVPSDVYSLAICNLCKKMGLDIQQYILKNEIIGDYSNINLNNNVFDLVKYYKNNIVLKNNDVKNQRNNFENNLNNFINDWRIKNNHLFNK